MVRWPWQPKQSPLKSLTCALIDHVMTSDQGCQEANARIRRSEEGTRLVMRCTHCNADIDEPTN
jgi:predicted SprT family Zn-dependent metalloprotease